MRVFLTLLILLIVLIVGAAWFVWSGAYNIAATQPHTKIVQWLLVTARDWSITQHSKDIEPPPLADSTLVQTGFRHYHAMCVMCHSAPGRELSEIAQGLNPAPPKLDAEEVQEWSDAELYWVIKHGIRMTGMPAFGPTHQEEDLWALVAFLRQLPGMKPQAYEDMREAAGLSDGAGEHGHHHAPAHGHESGEDGEEGPHTHEHGEGSKEEGPHPH